VLDIIKLTVVLTVVALAAGLAIGFVHDQTAEKIAQQQQRAQETALRQVFPEDATVEERTGEDPLPHTYWAARSGDALIGYAFRGSSRGYSSDIEFMIGVDPRGEIIGLSILSQSETPGLGARVQETPSTSYIWNGLFVKKEKVVPWFTQQFVGIQGDTAIDIRKGDEWHQLTTQQREELAADNAITAITGSTISTRAVTRGIESIIPAYLAALTDSSGGNQ
jgi:electron transport complex protein RnfG